MKNAAAATLAVALSTPLQAQERPSVAPKAMQELAPALAGYTDRVLFGDVWVRKELSPRDRSLVTVAILIATGKTAQLSGHLGRALTNGVQPSEVSGLVTQLAFYSGWPNAVSALGVVETVFTERKIDTAALRAALAAQAPLSASGTTYPPVEEPIAEVAPKFADLSRQVIADDLWRRTDLSPRDRSLITIAALAANGDSEQLRSEIPRAVRNGLSRQDLGEALTHLAFYAGWPKASAAIAIAAAVLPPASHGASADPALQVTPPGMSPTIAPASNFTGSVTVTSAFKGTGQARLRGASVTFQPGARTNWHSHPLGQLLVITAGSGLVQAEGEPVRRVKAGDTVWTGPGIKHWHGAAPDQAMTHVAVSEALDGKTVTWMQPVTDAEYRAR